MPQHTMNLIVSPLAQTGQPPLNYSLIGVGLAVLAFPYLVLRTWWAMPQSRLSALLMAVLGALDVIAGGVLLWVSISSRPLAIIAIACYSGLAILGIFVVIVFVLARRWRDRQAQGRVRIKLTEDVVDFLYTIDLQLTELMDAHRRGAPSDEAMQLFQTVLTFILESIKHTTLTKKDHDPHLSILEAIDGRFRVVAPSGVPPATCRAIEEKLFYDQPGGGIAGRCGILRQPVLVSNLQDSTSDAARAWVPLTEEGERHGSILAYPILAGIESGDVSGRALIAVLNITSPIPGFLEEHHKRIARHFAQRIELAFSCHSCYNSREL